MNAKSSCPPYRADPDAAAPDPAELALLCKALGHPVRVQLLNYLSRYGACYFGSLTDVVPLAASTVSQHVTVLKEAGLICGSSDEQRTSYCVDPVRLAQLKALVAAL